MKVLDFAPFVVCIFCEGIRVITLAEREVKDSRCSGKSQSCFFGTRLYGHAKSVGFWFYSAVWRSESRLSLRCLEITLTSLIYSLTYSMRKEYLFGVPGV